MTPHGLSALATLVGPFSCIGNRMLLSSDSSKRGARAVQVPPSAPRSSLPQFNFLKVSSAWQTVARSGAAVVPRAVCWSRVQPSPVRFPEWGRRSYHAGPVASPELEIW